MYTVMISVTKELRQQRADIGKNVSKNVVK